MDTQTIIDEINKLKEESKLVESQYTEELNKKTQAENELLTEKDPIEIAHLKGFIEGMMPEFNKLLTKKEELESKLVELDQTLELEKEKEQILHNSLEENNRNIEKIIKEITMSEKNQEEMKEEIKYYQQRLDRENLSPKEKQEMLNNISLLQEKQKKEIDIKKNLISKKDRITKLMGYTSNNGYDTIPEGERIMIIPTPEPTPTPDPTPTPTPDPTPTPTPEPNPPTGIISTEKKPGFFTKHKKAILIAAGLATLATAAVLTVPPLAAAMMYGNSVLWGACGNIPAVGGMIQAGLHGANMALSPLAGALGGFSAGAGTWTMSTGYVLNAGVASAGIADAIGAAIVNGSIATGAVIGFRKLTKKLKEKYQKSKEKSVSEKPSSPVTPNTPTEPTPTPIPIYDHTPIPQNDSTKETESMPVDTRNYYEILGIDPTQMDSINKEDLYQYLIKANTEILESNDKNSLANLKKLMGAYKTLSNSETKKQYDEYLKSQNINIGNSEGRKMA